MSCDMRADEQMRLYSFKSSFTVSMEFEATKERGHKALIPVNDVRLDATAHWSK